jgi:Protein of unknown function (DUF754).
MTMSLTTFLALFTVAASALTFVFLWTLGLFADTPPRRRAVYLGIASLGYTLATPVALIIGRAVDRASYWFAVACAFVSQHGGVYTPWSLVMFLACTASAVRLLTFRRGPSRHRAGYAAASWMIVCTLTATAVKIVFGIQPPPGPVQSIAVVAFTWCILVHRGNLAHVVRHLRAQVAILTAGRLR